MKLIKVKIKIIKIIIVIRLDDVFNTKQTIIIIIMNYE